MNQSLAPYPDYKSAGLPWLDRVPAHWEIIKVKHIFRERSKKGYPNEPLLAATQKQGVVLKTMVGTRTVEASKDFHLLKLVKVGDFVISLRSFEGGIEYAHYQGIISPAYNILTPVEPANAPYLAYILKAKVFVESLTLFVTGIREGQNIDNGKFSISFLPIPPLPEQQRIVSFLNAKGRQITRLLRHKRQLIKLLNEQKKALIHRAVTQGLDADAPRKDSGVAWLGEIPAHWEVKALKTVLKKTDYGTSESLNDEGLISVLTMGHIQDGKVLIPLKGSLNDIPEGLNLERYDLLFNRTNSPELVGKVGLFDYEDNQNITFASYLVRLRVNSEHNPFWLNYLLNSANFWAYARSQAFVSLHQANLNPTRYRQMLIPVPPPNEQRLIVNNLLQKGKDIDQTISRAQREIELIQEYRTRLVTDVVTGQVDVRYLADAAGEAVLPDELELEEEEDENEEVLAEAEATGE